ncbi:ImmA/IrrE family metallo-endopeptidase [Phytohabitans suffuscus]|uniref:IrrE N-terminal-like domain-containing protein n=1 Tax=Phytohabitans suffuscus TaxID=624315 RepID=A0A6F8YEK8_9ACTN|nr:ImmA/IrrE family metallo-endopeptidase [Phytohabitans suffuscus]BCB84463.1 hypothetical protein Psuf_017760 [Phytohabitans suffuscus]
MTQQHIEVPADFTTQIRRLAPKLPMTRGTASIVAEQQALRVRAIFGLRNTTRVPLGWIERIPNTRVQILGRLEVEAIARVPRATGVTRFEEDGTTVISLAENTSHAHKRFSLAHELKHLIDGLGADKTMYAQLGFGNRERRDRRIEGVANEFAACLLMPTALVTKAWDIGFKGVPELAGMFDVSEDAMYVRLKSLGLIRSYSRSPEENLAGL